MYEAPADTQHSLIYGAHLKLENMEIQCKFPNASPSLSCVSDAFKLY